MAKPKGMEVRGTLRFRSTSFEAKEVEARKEPEKDGRNQYNENTRRSGSFGGRRRDESAIKTADKRSRD